MQKGDYLPGLQPRVSGERGRVHGFAGGVHRRRVYLLLRDPLLLLALLGLLRVERGPGRGVDVGVAVETLAPEPDEPVERPLASERGKPRVVGGLVDAGPASSESGEPVVLPVFVAGRLLAAERGEAVLLAVVALLATEGGEPVLLPSEWSGRIRNECELGNVILHCAPGT